jgi:alpha/beta superfamily hydrolase
MTYEHFEFSSPAGYRLRGRLEMSDARHRGWGIFAHCFTCGKDGLAAARMAQALARQGISTLRFDFAGIGTSDGRFADTSFAADVRDLVAAGEAMAQADMPPTLLVGHSLGGAAAFAAAGDMATVRAIATIGAPADVAHVAADLTQEIQAVLFAKMDIHDDQVGFAHREGMEKPLATRNGRRTEVMLVQIIDH